MGQILPLPTSPQAASRASSAASLTRINKNGYVVHRQAPIVNNSLRAAGEEEGKNILTKALDGFRKGVLWVLKGPVVEEFKSRTVVSEESVTWANGQEMQAARAFASSQAGAARAKLGARAAEFDAVAARLGRDPMAHAALTRMALAGTLTDKKDLKGQGDVLSHLHAMSTQVLGARIDRDDLISNFIEELEVPEKMNQQGKGTCVATSATITATRLNPAETARLVAGLSTAEGKVAMVNGKILERKEDWDDSSDFGRTASLRLLQPALMEYGNGFLRYDNKGDYHSLHKSWLHKFPAVDAKIVGFFDWLRSLVKLPGGLETFGANKVLEGLTGQQYSPVMIFRFNKESTVRKIGELTDKGRSVPVGLYWEGGGHKVVVDKIQGNTVHITNPWGDRETMSLEEFKMNLTDANLPKF